MSRASQKLLLQKDLTEAQKRKQQNQQQATSISQSSAITLPDTSSLFSSSVPGEIFQDYDIIDDIAQLESLADDTQYSTLLPTLDGNALKVFNANPAANLAVFDQNRTSSSCPPEIIPKQEHLGPSSAPGRPSASAPASPLDLSTSDDQDYDIIDDIAQLESLADNTQYSTLLPTLDGNALKVFHANPAANLAVFDQNRTSSFCPIEIIPKQDHLDVEVAVSFMQDRVKKDNYNHIERQRRHNINDWIKELGTLIPKSSDPDMRWNKGSILKAAVNHIRDLQGKVVLAQQIEKSHHDMKVANKRLLLRIQELEICMKSNGMEVPPMQDQQDMVEISLKPDQHRFGTGEFSKGHATLVEGDHVNQSFENSTVNVVAGDLSITNIFRDAVTEYIGPEGGKVEVNGCLITFPAGCFDQTRRVFIKIAIAPETWPPDKVGITPTLHIEAPDLNVPATVKLPTWCISDNKKSLMVEVLRLGYKNDWELVHRSSLGKSRNIEFEIDHFSDIIGTIKKRILGIYVLFPSVYYSGRRFAVTTTLDDDTARGVCKRKITKALGDTPRCEDYCTFTCKSRHSIRSKIFSHRRQDAFEFIPAEFDHSLNEVEQAGGSYVDHTTLQSNEEATEVLLRFQVFKNDKMKRDATFPYDWKPNEILATEHRIDSFAVPGSGVSASAQYGSTGTGNDDPMDWSTQSDNSMSNDNQCQNNEETNRPIYNGPVYYNFTAGMVNNGNADIHNVHSDTVVNPENRRMPG